MGRARRSAPTPLWSTQHTTTTQPRCYVLHTYVRRRRRASNARGDASQLSRWAPCLHTWARRAVRHASPPTFSCTGVVVAARVADSRITHAPTTAPVKQSQAKKEERKEGWERRRGKTLPRPVLPLPATTTTSVVGRGWTTQRAPSLTRVACQRLNAQVTPNCKTPVTKLTNIVGQNFVLTAFCATY